MCGVCTIHKHKYLLTLMSMGMTMNLSVDFDVGVDMSVIWARCKSLGMGAMIWVFYIYYAHQFFHVS